MSADYAPAVELAPPLLVQNALDEAHRRGVNRQPIGADWTPERLLHVAACALRSRWQRPVAQQIHPDDSAVGMSLADLMDAASREAHLIDETAARTILAHELAVAHAVVHGATPAEVRS